MKQGNGKGVVVVEDEIKPLSVREEKRLEQLEDVVIKGFKARIEQGLALEEIQRLELWRGKAPTFEKYCKDLFDLAKASVYRFINAAKVIENVSNWRLYNGGDVIEMVPQNEAQARPLTQLKRPEQQIAVWRAAVETAPNGKVTASHVSKVVKAYLGEKIEKRVRRSQEKIRRAHVSAEFKELFDKFSEQILAEKRQGYKLTSRGIIVQCLDQLRAEIAEDGEFVEDSVVKGGSDDTNKLITAGFTLFRMDRTSMTIKFLDGAIGRGWSKHSGPYDTLKEMEAEFKLILQDEKHLRR